MKNAFTNLLPIERRHALRRDYFLRLAVVGVTLVIVLAGVAGALLVPTYVFLTQSAGTKQARLASIEATLSSGDEAALSTRLSALTRDAGTLASLGNAPTASAILRALVAVPHTGVLLTSFTYTPASPKALATLAISGVAATRDALRNYQLALQSVPFARSADLPVSAYAKDSDSAFTITVALTAPTP